MLRIRVKMGPTRNREWTCCFGLHVRTATIMIGTWHLFLNIIALGALAVIIRNPAMVHELENGYDDYSRMNEEAPALPTPLSKIDAPYAYRDHSIAYHNVDMGGIVCVCMIAISLMLIYGAVKYKPSHLLPFFCLQLFDFAITTLTAAGYLCYLRSVHRVIDQSHRLPWRDELLKLSPQALSILVLLVFIMVVLLKAYAIGIVWRCYKYLTIRQHNIRSMLPYIIPEMPTTRQERDYNTLLPDYEEALRQSMKQPPPPYCQVVIANNPSGMGERIVTTASVASSSSSISAAATINTPTMVTASHGADHIGTPPIYSESDSDDIVVASTSADVTVTAAAATATAPKNDSAGIDAAPKQPSSSASQ